MIGDLNNFFYNYIKYQTLLHCKKFMVDKKRGEIKFLLEVAQKDLKRHEKKLDKTIPHTKSVNRINEASVLADTAKVEALQFCLELCGNEDYNKFFNRERREVEKKYKGHFAKLPKKVLLCSLLKLADIVDEYSDEIGVETGIRKSFIDLGTNKTNLKFENCQVSMIDNSLIHGHTDKKKPAFYSVTSFKNFGIAWPFGIDSFLDLSQIYLTQEVFDAMPEDSRITDLDNGVAILPNFDNFNFDPKLRDSKFVNGKFERGKQILGGLEKLCLYSCIAQNIEKEQRLNNSNKTTQASSEESENQ